MCVRAERLQTYITSVSKNRDLFLRHRFQNCLKSMDEQSTKSLKPTYPNDLPDLPGYCADPPPYQPHPSGSGAGPYLVQLPPNYPARNVRYPPGAQVIQLQGPVVTGRAPISVRPRPHATLAVMLCVFLCMLFFIVPTILGVIFAMI